MAAQVCLHLHPLPPAMLRERVAQAAEVKLSREQLQAAQQEQTRRKATQADPLTAAQGPMEAAARLRLRPRPIEPRPGPPMRRARWKRAATTTLLPLLRRAASQTGSEAPAPLG